MSKWIIVNEPDGTAIGPFESKAECDAYKVGDLDAPGMRVMEIYPPARGWKAEYLRAQRRA